MADIEQVRLPDGTTYDIKDHTIRDEVKYKIYDSIADLPGFTSSDIGNATIPGAYAAMSEDEALICDASEFTMGTGGVPSIYGTVSIIKRTANGSRGIIEYYSKSGDTLDFTMKLLSDNTPTNIWIPRGWKKIWENDSPTSTFTNQTIALNLEPYSYVIVAFLGSSSELRHTSAMAARNCWGRAEALLNMTWNSTVTTAGAQRSFVFLNDNSGIYFENCAVRGNVATGYAPTVIDTCLIPQYIVGVP